MSSKLLRTTALFLSMACAVPVSIAEERIWDKPTPILKDGSGVMTVYRSPTCGCCGKWIEHMKKHGFAIKDVQTGDMPAIKHQQSVPEELASCHTAIIDGYVVEGHVPAGDVKKMLAGKVKMLGLAAPGMPAGSPGMEMAGKKDRFSILSFDKLGNADRFADYSGY